MVGCCIPAATVPTDKPPVLGNWLPTEMARVRSFSPGQSKRLCQGPLLPFHRRYSELRNSGRETSIKRRQWHSVGDRAASARGVVRPAEPCEKSPPRRSVRRTEREYERSVKL